MKKILFHICCGPCATASVRKVRDDHYEVTGFYYNPNIYPKAEYEKRLAEAKRFAEVSGMQFVIPKYRPKEYLEAVKGHEEHREERCRRCWKLRLEETAKLAKELSFESFGTSLRISPYQNQAELLSMAKEIARINKLSFYDVELTPLYRDSINLSKEMEMYRQKYCGCAFSLKEVQKKSVK